MFETRTRLRKQPVTDFALACLFCVSVLVMTSGNVALPVAAQNKPLTREQVSFPHHHKVMDPRGQPKIVSSPIVQLFANTRYYILVFFMGGTSSVPGPRHVALYKWAGSSNTDCFDNECWSLVKKFSETEQKMAEYELEFSEDTKLLITSWPMGFFENRSCEIDPTTQGEGLKFTFPYETNNMVRIGKTPLKLR